MQSNPLLEEKYQIQRELLGDQSNIKGRVKSRVKTLPLASRSLKLIWPLSQPDSGKKG